MVGNHHEVCFYCPKKTECSVICKYCVKVTVFEMT